MQLPEKACTFVMWVYYETVS